LLATRGGQLEDANLAVGHQIQALASVSFVEQQFSAIKSLAGHMDGKRGHLGAGQAREEWSLPENLFNPWIHGKGFSFLRSGHFTAEACEASDSDTAQTDKARPTQACGSRNI
jgi:hypothetical protein